MLQVHTQKKAYNENLFSFVKLDSEWIVGSFLNMFLFKRDDFHLTKFGYEKISLLFVKQFNSVLRKTQEALEEPQHDYSYKLAIFFTLNKEEFPSLLFIYNAL